MERAALIKSLQSQHRLPLGKIRAIVKASERGEKIEPLVALVQEVFSQDQGKRVDTEQFLAATGMESEYLEQLLDTELLLPLEPGLYDQQDLAMAYVYMHGRNMGMKQGDASFYVRLGKQIVEEEMRLRARLTRDLPPEMDAQMTLALVQSARALRSYVIDRLFQLRIAAMSDLEEPAIPEQEKEDVDGP